MRIAIIGNGISGVTAARYIRKYSDHEILLISGETEYFFSRTALMYVFMGHMDAKDVQPYEPYFWKKNRIQLVKAWVSKIDTDKKCLVKEDGETISYDKLVIASGSQYNKFGWPGQDLNGVQGMYSWLDLETLEDTLAKRKVKNAVVVGGGLIGIELAEMLHTRNVHVSFLVRENSYWSNVLPEGESEIVNRHIREHGFDLRLSTELDEIISDDEGWVSGIRTKEGEEISCEIVGLTAGVRPNIQFLTESGIETDRGVLINRSFETNVKDIYAIGDCAQFREPLPDRAPVEQVWYTGKMHGKVVAKNICEKENRKHVYDPGPWFNSAKFLDIEYQTYGVVKSKLRDNETAIYWEHPEGKIAIHIVYNKENGQYIGINLMGIRHRHELHDKWLRQGAHVETVLQNLAAANFDPEFYDQYEEEILAVYNAKHKTNLKKKGKGIRSFLQLMRG